MICEEKKDFTRPRQGVRVLYFEEILLEINLIWFSFIAG